MCQHWESLFKRGAYPNQAGCGHQNTLLTGNTSGVEGAGQLKSQRQNGPCSHELLYTNPLSLTFPAAALSHFPIGETGERITGHRAHSSLDFLALSSHSPARILLSLISRQWSYILYLGILFSSQFCHETRESAPSQADAVSLATLSTSSVICSERDISILSSIPAGLFRSSPPKPSVQGVRERCSFVQSCCY